MLLMLTDLPIALYHNILDKILLRQSTNLRTACRATRDMAPAYPSIHPYILKWSYVPRQGGSWLRIGCRFFFTLQAGTYRKIISQNRTEAMLTICTRVLLAQKKGSHKDINHPTLCELTHMSSIEMLRIVQDRWGEQDILSVAANLVIHADHHGRGSTIMTLLEQGHNKELLGMRIAQQVLASPTLLTHLYRTDAYHTQNSTILICIKKKLASAVLSITSPGMAIFIMETTSMPVFHLMVLNCTAQNETETVDALMRCFLDCPLEFRNARAPSLKGHTVLQILYAKRPLNRRILTVFNYRKHDTEAFET